MAGPSRSAPARVRRLLLAWFDREARDLPWRRRRDPWRVWVSEVMLQQTRVETVVDRFDRFLESFPTVEAMARADESDVLAAWSGLGYYRRARGLHAGARFVLREHGGEVPRSRAALEAVPGIGAYTAGAVASIAFGQREAAVDANVTRVVTRLTGERDPAGAAGRARVAAFAAALVDDERPGDVNEALMDLGSAVCTARAARCGACPLRAGCAAAASGEPLAFGAARPRRPPRAVSLSCAVVRCGERVLFARRPADDALLAGLWDLPTLEVDDGAAAAGALASWLRSRAGLRVELEGPVAEVRHEIVGRRIVARVWTAVVAKPPQHLAEDVRLLSEEERAGVGVPALPVKILRALSNPATRLAPRPGRAARGAA